MTVPAIVRRKDYTCDGSNVTFPYTWKVAAASELKVKIRDLSNNEVTLVYPTDFSITGLNVTDGGNIVTTAAYAAGYHLTILPSLEIKQTASFRNQNSFYPWKHEDALDYLTMLLQQQDEELGRCMKLSDTNTDVAYDMPVAVSGSCWGWDASGNSVAYPLVASSVVYGGSNVGAALVTHTGLLTTLGTIITGGDATKGAGQVAYNPAMPYANGTVGAALNAAQPGGGVSSVNLADSTTAANGAGMVGYSSGLSYASGTVGYALKNAFNPAAPGAIGGTTPGSGAFTALSSREAATLNSLSVTTTLTVTSTAIFSGNVQVNGSLSSTGSFREKKNALAASAIDCSTGNVFSKTISATTTFTVTNVPGAGNAFVLILDLTNGGAYAITWWSGVKWSAGTAPTLTASGRDVLGFITHDGGTTWSGFVLGKALA